jgi:hypothetical protein
MNQTADILSPPCSCCGSDDMLTPEEYTELWRDSEGYYCKACVKKLTTPPRVKEVTGEPKYVTQMRKICSGHSAAGVTDEKGKRYMCDAFTASAVTQVWDSLNEENKKKFAALPLMKAIKVTWSMVK